MARSGAQAAERLSVCNFLSSKHLKNHLKRIISGRTSSAIRPIMKPLSTGALAGLLFASALIQGTSATVNLEAAVKFDIGNACSGQAGSISMTLTPAVAASGANPAQAAGVPSCVSSSSACSSGSKTICASDGDFEAKILDTMGAAMPYVTITTYTGATCTAGDISTSISYAADGACHPLSSGFFKVVVATGTNVATIKTYTNSGCTIPDTSVPDNVVTSTKLGSTTPSAGCNVVGGIASLYKVSAHWPTAIKAGTSFDGSDCSKRANLVSVTGSCTADTTCANGAGAICTTNFNYDSAIATAYATAPYVTVSSYSGAACTWWTLTSATAYTADGKCRVITSGSKYYKVIFSAGTDSVTIKFFTDSGCSTAHADSDISITQTILTTSSGCDGATAATKYAYSSSWPTPKKAITTYDGGDCTTLGSISVGAGPCTNSNNADVDCASGAGEICTSNINYELAIATKFGSTPHLTIARFSGAACTWSTFSSAKAYLADGKCHQYDTNKYYKLTAVPLGGGAEPTILLYTDSACATADTNNIAVTRSKLTTVGSSVTGCDTAASGGAAHYKVSSNWPKAMSVVGVGAYTVPGTGAACVGGVPSKLTLTDVSASGTVCGTTRGCASATALTDCTTVTGYSAYLKTAFGSVPYLVKETYTSGCGTLNGATAWAADGTCIVDGANSFKVVATSGGIAQRTYTGVTDCSATTSTDSNPVTAAQLVSNACVSNAKYYMGGSWVLGSSAVYDDNKCALTPNKLTLGWAPTCTAPTGADTCVETATTGATPKTVYNAPGCAKATDYFTAIDKAFGMTSYVVQESYTSSCGSLIGVTAYVADAKCHLGADAASSFNATYDVNGTTAQVKIDSFANTDCSSTAASTTSVAAAAITGKTCVADTKTYIGGLATKLTAVTTYSDKDCTKPVQTVFSSPASTCTAVTACTASGSLFTKTACTNAKTDYNAVLATVYTTTRRLVSDIYEAKDTNKCGARQGIVAYVGDGACHTTLDGTFFKVTLGSSNTATDATFSTYSDKDCTKDEKPLTIAAGNLATATTAPCDGTNSIKWSIGGTEPVTEAPATDAPTPAPTTAVSTGSGKSAAVSSFSVSIFGLLASIFGGLAVLLN